MRRREFITLVGGAAAAWPVVTRAQQTDRVRRIGVLINLAAGDPEGQARLTAFLQALHQLGWIEGSTVRIDTRWGAGNVDRYRESAAELVALAPVNQLAFRRARCGRHNRQRCGTARQNQFHMRQAPRP